MSESTQVLLKRRSEGVPVPEDFELATAPVPEPADGQLLAETLFVSLDPYLRGRISGRHLSGALQPGDMMSGEAVSRVLVSRSDKFKPGDIVAAMSGWQSHPIIDAAGARRVDPDIAPVSTTLGILGMPGLTAYAGLLRLGEPKPGDTLVVSAASGPVGSMVAQIGKIKGCRVIGIAGSDEKCRWVTETAGMDGCINYKDGDLREAISQYCPEGLDIYFDNVGGDMLQAMMEHLAIGARVVLCGLMAQYNNPGEMPPGPNPAWIIKARATVRGMVVYDHEDLRWQMVSDCARWLADGRIKYIEDITDGLENAPEAFCRLMSGQNFGKALVRVAE
ncbi:MAG: NADP-dependent oxidoreductase [Gammaproteobacteria bacterium]|nr:NADP-dependent oxidoreductase [Gammaproteobacteria bacterium]